MVVVVDKLKVIDKEPSARHCTSSHRNEPKESALCARLGKFHMIVTREG